MLTRWRWPGSLQRMVRRRVRLLVNTLSLAVWMIYPKLCRRAPELYGIKYLFADRLGNLCVDAVEPCNNRWAHLCCRLTSPLHDAWLTLRSCFQVARFVERQGYGNAVPEVAAEMQGVAHGVVNPPNDPSSANRPTGGDKC